MQICFISSCLTLKYEKTAFKARVKVNKRKKLEKEK